MIRRPPRSTPLYSSAASDVYKRQILETWTWRRRRLLSSRGEGGDPRSGRMMEETGFESLGDLLRHSPLKGDNPQARIAVIWEEVVGSEVARNAHPRFLRQGRLVVATRSSVWAQSLQFMGDEVKRRLNY